MKNFFKNIFKNIFSQDYCQLKFPNINNVPNKQEGGGMQISKWNRSGGNFQWAGNFHKAEILFRCNISAYIGQLGLKLYWGRGHPHLTGIIIF